MANFRITDQQFGPTGADRSVFEVPMIANKNGEIVTTTNRFPVDAVIGGSASYVNTGNLSGGLDAFGRLRVSEPLTIFDSTHRFADNDLWASKLTTSGTATFNANEGLVDLEVTDANGSEVLRETYKVMGYQPGKSLLVLATSVFNEAKTGLRQRSGYFSEENGFYLELDNNDLGFVKRSYNTGSVVNTKVSQADWNVDKMDGTGPSELTLDITKAQILWMDLEWLGVGSVRIGFVINGQFVVCHIFHNANFIDSTYMTTASLPLRMEITNTSATSGASKLKQICHSVMSEGGYDLRGTQQGVGTTITLPATLTTAGTYYPVIALRLKTTGQRLDAIAILSDLSFLGLSNNANYNYRITQRATVTGGTWVSAGANSSVEYNLTGTGVSSGRILAQGFAAASNQSQVAVNILKEALFRFQLERDPFTPNAYAMVLEVAASSNSSTCHASMDWEEVTR
jgi:hypothetical protein